jgi:mono/diheme cytochrome c family protein
MKRLVFGFLLGLLTVPLLGLGYLKFGRPPVAVADPLLPFEKELVRLPLYKRIESEAPKTAPLKSDAAALAAGAAVYAAQCAACHGRPDRPSSFAKGMFPRAPQLFERHGDHVGVSDDEPGETYWKVKNGIRLTGMPSYSKVLSDTEMWQVTLLLAGADKLSPEQLQLLKEPAPAAK